MATDRDRLVSVTLTLGEWLTVCAAVNGYWAEVQMTPILSARRKREDLRAAVALRKRFAREFPLSARGAERKVR